MVKTLYKANLFDNDTSNFIFTYLRDNIQWQEGVRSKSGFTRLGKSVNLTEDDIIGSTVMIALEKMGITAKVYGCYLNYYKDGSYYTPNHTHPGTVQMVLSFNERDGERKLKVGTKDYLLENGSGIVFGGSSHGIAKEENRNGRISIATFMKID